MDMYAVTKTDLNAIKQGDRIAVHINSLHPAGLVRVIKENRPTDKQPFAQDVEHIVPASAVQTNHAHEQGQAIKCFELLYLWGSDSIAKSVFGMLKPGDRIRFEFRPDYYANGYAKKAGIHVDALHLRVMRGEGQKQKAFTFLLDVSACEDNSARMVEGVPFAGILD